VRLPKPLPNLLLPALLLPQLEERDHIAIERLNTVDLGGPLMEDCLTPTGALTAYFTREVLQRLASCGLIRDANGHWQQLENLFLPHERWLDEANDELVAALCHVQWHDPFPAGFFGHAREMRAVLEGVNPRKFHFLTPRRLEIATVCGAVIAARQGLRLNDAQAAAFLALIGWCPRGNAQQDPLEVVRDAAIPLLPCTSGLLPLPAPFVRGRRADRPSPKTPLVFFRPERSSRQEDVEEESRASTISPPAFCHVHVLRDEVLQAATGHLGPAGLRQILRDLGMREFQPQDIFIRVSEAIHSSGRVHELTAADHRTLLNTTLGLLGLRLRGWAAARHDIPQPWFLRSANDSD
jgi:hypothetical protein